MTNVNYVGLYINTYYLDKIHAYCDCFKIKIRYYIL